MKLPWNDVFTTNYDTLLERAAEHITNRRYHVIRCKEDLVNSGDTPRIIKLHGSFPSYRPFIITEEDYRTYPVKFATMVNTVQQSLIENVFCMIGFSCEDPNFINWIGWIHDNLGKSSSQKIYMISVSPISETKRKMYADRNIIVVELEKLWSNLERKERIEKFLQTLSSKVEQQKSSREWISFGEILSEEYDGITDRNRLLNRMCDSYPGWIFLPWRQKKKITYFLNKIERVPEGYKECGNIEKLNYIYYFSKIHDISGRPIMKQKADSFLNEINSMQWSEKELNDSKTIEEKEQKEQYIYLQLLRTYRECFAWMNYDECYKKIDNTKLSYDLRQFLYAEECRKCIAKFEIEELSDRLSNWKTADWDVYWPLIKASLLSMVGEYVKAQDILLSDLASIREQMAKYNGNAYLESIEESCVSLFNFIKQNEFQTDKIELEKSVNEGTISWWDENEKYILNIEGEDIRGMYRETKFDLSLSYTTIYREPKRIYYSMEYWRFLEMTGHMFRLGSVTNKEGLKNTIKKLSNIYPEWSLTQLMFAQDDKHIDLLYGRANLANMTCEKVDCLVDEYLNVFLRVIQKTAPNHHFYSKTIYDHAAIVLPIILSRLCYKCSVKKLDKILEELINANIFGETVKINNLGVLLEAIMGAFTSSQQQNRLEKILLFPIISDKTLKYSDPISYSKRPKSKCMINKTLYAKVIMQIRQLVEFSNEYEVRNDAINRLIILQQIILLEKEDEEYLYQKLEEKKDYYLLLHFKGNISKENSKSLIDSNINQMKNEMETPNIRLENQNYNELSLIVDEFKWTEIDLIEILQTLEKYIEFKFKERATYDMNQIVKQVINIFLGIIINIYTCGDDLPENIDSIIKEIISSVEENTGGQIIFDIVYRYLIKNHEIDGKFVETFMWTCSSEKLELIGDLMYHFFKQGVTIDKNLKKHLSHIAEIIIKRTMQADYAISKINLDVLKYFIELNCISQQTLDLLVKKILVLINETKVSSTEEENEAIEKIKCRITACDLASHILKKQQYSCPELLEWKKISENQNEFSEIRTIEFK